jgi:hypothetical protein
MKAKPKTKNNSKFILNKKWAIILSGIAIIAIVIILIMKSFGDINENTVVATVDSEPITFNEFKNSLSNNRALIYGYFKGTHDADDNKEFWTTSYNGEVPLDKIKEDALKDCIEIRVKLIMAKELGLVEDISYQKFYQDFIAENKRRKTAYENNEVIYGPIEYDESEYYGIVNSTIFGKLEEAYIKNKEFSEESLKNYYDENREELFKSPDELRTIKVYVHYLSADNITKEEALKLMEDVKSNLEAGMDIKSATMDERLIVEEQLLDPRGAHSYGLLNPILTSEALKLNNGEVTEVIDEGGNFNIVQCIEKSNSGYLEFNEGAKDSISKSMAKKEFKTIIESRIKEAVIIKNKKVYDRIDEQDVNSY